MNDKDLTWSEYFESLSLNKGQKSTDLELTPEKAHDLAVKIYSNAIALFEDAVILHKNERFSRANALAILSIEEFGKIDLILKLILTDKSDTKTLRNLWNDFRNHKSKNYKWMYYFLQLENAKIDLVSYLTRKNSNANKFLDDYKMYSFYVDINNAGEIYSPSTITKEDADNMMYIVSALLLNDPGPPPVEYYTEYIMFFKDRKSTTQEDWKTFYDILLEKKIIDKVKHGKIMKNLQEFSK